MTLDRHELDGIGRFSQKTLPAEIFEQQMLGVGYSKSASAPAQGRRIKVWWTHAQYRRVESIYSPDLGRVITAYHPNSL